MTNYAKFDPLILGQLSRTQSFVYNPLTAHLALLSPAELKTLNTPSLWSTSNPLLKSLLAKNCLYIPGRAPQIEVTSPKEWEFWIHMTWKCNLNCPYCFVDHTVTPAQNIFLTDEGRQQVATRVIKEAKRRGFTSIKFKYAGGEPTIHLQDIFALHTLMQKECHLAGLCFHASLITNGTLLDEQKIQSIIDHQIQVAISVDGWGSVHDRTRRYRSGQSSFADVVRTIETFARYDGYYFNVAIVVHKDNIASLPRLITYLMDRPKPIPVSITFVRDHLGTQKDLNVTNVALIRGLTKTYHEIKRCLQKNHTTLPVLRSLLDYVDFRFPHQRSCGASSSYTTLSPTGAMSSCHMLLDKPVSNLFGNNPSDPLLHDPNLPLDQAKIQTKYGCSDCPLRYNCTAGCPLLTKLQMGAYNTPSPYCEVYRNLGPKILALQASLNLQ